MEDRVKLSEGFLERLNTGVGFRVILCPACAHYLGSRACKAFSMIPEPIWRGEVLHTKEWPGDGGYRFQPKE